LVEQLNVKPPSGIAEVRRYIEQTADDMPLRVSVHTNCTKPAIAAMIRLMQEQGEIVCVVGSQSCARSCEVYGVGDVAIAMRPQRPACLDESTTPAAWLLSEQRRSAGALPVTSLLVSSLFSSSRE
jgi:hypothetical protein